MDNIFSSNISQRSEEGNIGKNQWNIFKKFCLWAAAAAVIPLRLDIDNKFQKLYLLLVIMSIIMPALYFVVEIDNTNAEKKYLKMIYPVEDKLLEILEY